MRLMARKQVSKELRDFLAGLGGRIKDLRRSAGWTQKQLAERLYADWSVIRNYEHGLTQPPAFTLYRLARVFNVSVDFLAAGQDKQLESFHDKELQEYCTRADGLDPLRRGLLKEFIDTMLLKSRLEHEASTGSSRRR